MYSIYCTILINQAHLCDHDRFFNFGTPTQTAVTCYRVKIFNKTLDLEVMCDTLLWGFEPVTTHHCHFISLLCTLTCCNGSGDSSETFFNIMLIF